MGHDKKTGKTNAARLLDELGITYDMHEAEVDLDDLYRLIQYVNDDANISQGS